MKFKLSTEQVVTLIASIAFISTLFLDVKVFIVFDEHAMVVHHETNEPTVDIQSSISDYVDNTEHNFVIPKNLLCGYYYANAYDTLNFDKTSMDLFYTTVSNVPHLTLLDCTTNINNWLAGLKLQKILDDEISDRILDEIETRNLDKSC